jgi:adenylyl-sulfate kinase
VIPINSNIVWHNGKVEYEERCENLKQKGLVLWFTGLSGSGKSTIAVEVEKQLYEKGYATYLLDGDNIRHGLNSNLGFSDEDREENLRRIREVAALFKDAGLITLVSFISPFRKSREETRKLIGEENFIEIYIKADIETCSKRDPKGLYEKALKGEIPEFTGISSPYEEPENPEILVDTRVLSIDESVAEIVEKINEIQNDSGYRAGR